MSTNSGVKNGILLGVASVLFSQICYMVNPKSMLNGVAFLGYIIIVYFMYRAAVEERGKNESLLSFGEALKVTFLTFVIGTLISALYVYLMFNYFDPSLHEVLREVSTDTAEFVMKMLGGEDKVDDLREQMENQNVEMTFSAIFLNYLFGLIFPGFVLALVISAITKKENSNA